MAIRLVIVDDQALIRSGLLSILNVYPDIEVAGEAADGVEAVPLVKELRPDVVLMDLNLPQINGVEATRQLMRLPEPPRVLVLTTFGADDRVLDALNAGAAGFLLKDVRVDELVASIRAVASGTTSLSPEIAGTLIRRAQSHSPVDMSGLSAKVEQLSDSERLVLGLVGAGMSNQQIADELHLSVTSVKTYVSRVLKRFGLDNRTQAALLAHEVGLLEERDALRRTESS